MVSLNRQKWKSSFGLVRSLLESGMRVPKSILLLFLVTLVGGAPTVVAQTNAAGFNDRAPRYELVPGDTLNVRFEFTPEFNQENVAVQPDGFVSLQAVGDIQLAGHTLPEVKTLLQESYAKVLRQPVISVTLQEFSKPYFVASGYVARPGKYDLRGPTTLTEAVAIAGGFRDGAKHSQVWVFHRLRDGTVQSKRVDVKRMLAKGELDEDPRLNPGDTLYVPQSVLSKLEGFVIPRATLGPTLSPSMKP
jgi:protein involved in polysaccharide export with SLBB domain